MYYHYRCLLPSICMALPCVLPFHEWKRLLPADFPMLSVPHVMPPDRTVAEYKMDSMAQSICRAMAFCAVALMAASSAQIAELQP